MRDINLSLFPGDYVGIVGSNGSGKTTLLRTLLGLLRPQSGTLTMGGDGRVLHFGYVPQLQTVDEIFPLTVFDVVLMGRYGRIGALRRPGGVDRDKALSSLEEVGIGGLAPRLYRDLSGGQKQRALIARALANDPDILILDEHTNDLDITAERAIMGLIDRLHDERHLAVVMVTHSLNTVANHTSKIGILSDGQLELAPVDVVLEANYLEKLYGLPLRVIEVDGLKVVV